MKVKKQEDLKKSKKLNCLLVGISGSHNSYSLSLYNLKAYTFNDPIIRHNWKINIIQESLITQLDYQERIEKLIGKITLFENIDLIGFSCYIWNMEYILEICKILKSKIPNSKIILGGPEISKDLVQKGLYNELNVDYLVFGEGEKPFKNILETIQNNQSFDKIKGIAYKINNYWNVNDAEIPFSSIVEIPSPYTSGCVDDEILSNEDIHANIETQRGCYILLLAHSFCAPEIIQAANLSGYNVIVVDYDIKKLYSIKNPNLYINQSTYDFNKIINDKTFTAYKNQIIHIFSYSASQETQSTVEKLKKYLHIDCKNDKYWKMSYNKKLYNNLNLTNSFSLLKGITDENELNMQKKYIVKPPDTCGSKNIEYLSCTEAKEYILNDNFILQEYIGKKLFTIDGICYDNKLYMCLISQKKSRTKKFITSEYSSIKHSDKILFEKIEAFIAKNNLNGFFSLDLIKYKDKYYLIDFGLLFDLMTEQLLLQLSINPFEIYFSVCVKQQKINPLYVADRYSLSFIYPQDNGIFYFRKNQIKQENGIKTIIFNESRRPIKKFTSVSSVLGFVFSDQKSLQRVKKQRKEIEQSCLIKKKKNILYLGAGIQHIEAIKTLREHFIVGIVDKNPDNVCKKYADYYIKSDSTNIEIILQSLYNIKKEFGLPSVIMTLTELTTPTSILKKLLNIKHSNVEGSYISQSKSISKEIWMQSQTPITKSIKVDNFSDINQVKDQLKHLQMPLVIKPENSFGGKGITKLTTIENLSCAIATAQKENKNSGIIIEEYIDGFICDGNGFIDKDGKFILLSISDRYFDSSNIAVEDSVTIPTKLSKKQIQIFKKIFEKACIDIGINYGPVKIDTICDGKDFYVLEVATRLHGPKGTLYLYPEYYGSSLILDIANTLYDDDSDRLLKYEKLLCSNKTQMGYNAIKSPFQGIIKNIQGLDKLEKHKNIFFLQLFKHEGNKISEVNNSSDVIGYVFYKFKNSNELSQIKNFINESVIIETI